MFFDRDRYVYYTLSHDNGDTWDKATLIKKILNDKVPYDTQPHLWNDGNDWWVYFCKDNNFGRRSIYKSKQEIKGDWDSWGDAQLVIAPNEIKGNHGVIFGIGEPTLTTNGELSFVVIYGDVNSDDKTDMLDCDPWFLPKIK